MKCREASPANSSSSPYYPAFLGPPTDASGGLPPAVSVSSAAGRSDDVDEDLSSGTSSFVDSAVSTASGRDGDSREPTGEDEAPKSDPQRTSPSLESNETVTVEPDALPLTWDKMMSSFPPPLPSPGTGGVADSQRVSLANEEELKGRELSGVVKDGDDEQERTSCRDREEQGPPHVSPQLSPWVCENGADEVRGESLYRGMSHTPDQVPGRDSNGDPVLLSLPIEAETRPGASISLRPDSQACSPSLETHHREQATPEGSRVPAKTPADAGVSDYRPKTALEPNMPAAAPTEAGTAKIAKLAVVDPVLPAESSESSGKDEGSLLVGGQRHRGGLAPQHRRSSRVAVSAVDDTTPPQSLAWWMVCWPPPEETSDPFSDVASLQKPASSKDPRRRDSSLSHDLPSGNAESCAFVPLAADGRGRRTCGAGGEGRDPRGETRSLAPLACEAQMNGNWNPEDRRCGGAHATEQANSEAGESDLLFSSEFAASDESEETLRPVPFSFCPSRREAENNSREDSPARRSLSPPSRWRQHLEEQLSMEIPPPEWLRDPYSRRPRLVSDAFWARPSHSGETGVFCGGAPLESGRDCCSGTWFGGAGHETVPAPQRRRRGRPSLKARRVPNSDFSPTFPEGGETAGPPFESGFPSRSPFASYPDASRLPLMSRGESRSGPERSMSPPCGRRDDAGRLQRDSGTGAGGSERGSAVAWGPGAGLGSSETRGRGGPSRGPLPRSRRDASAQPVPGPRLTVRDLISPRVGTCCCGPTGVCPMCQRTKRGLQPAVASSTARRETAAAFAAAADELLIADGLPPGSYTPAALGSLGTRDVSLSLVERFLGSLLGGDTRLGDLTAPGFHLAWMAYHFLRRLSATSRLPWGLAHAKGPRAAFGPQGPAGKSGKSDPTGLHQQTWTERGRRPSPAGGAKGEGPRGGGGPRDPDGARVQAKGVQLKQRSVPTPHPLRSVQGGGHRERDNAGLPSTGTRGEVGLGSLAKRETLERTEGGTAAVEGPRLSGVNSGGLPFASANLGSSRAVGVKIEDKSGRAERRAKREESGWGFAQMRKEMPLEDGGKEHRGKRRGAIQPDREADDGTRDLGGPLWQTNFGFVDNEWPRFVCGTIDRRWALQQCNLSVRLNVAPSPRPTSPASGASRGPGPPRAGSRSSPSTVRTVGDKDSRSVSSPFPSLSTKKQEAEGGAREKGDTAEKRGPKSPASSQNPSLSALASPVERNPDPAGVHRRSLTASPPAPARVAAPSEGVSPGSRPPASPLGDTSGPASPLRPSAVPTKASRGDTVDKPKGEKKKGRGSTPAKETAGRTPGGSTAGYEVAVQFEEFPFSAAEWMWPKPLDLPETLMPGLEVQVAIEVRGRFAQWWVDAVVESVSSDGVCCLLTTDEGCLASPESERRSVSASPPLCSRRPPPGLQGEGDTCPSIRENGDTSSPFTDMGPKSEGSSFSPLVHSKKRPRADAGEEERSAAIKLPRSLVKRERSEQDGEGPQSAEPDVGREQAVSVERREDSGGVDYFGPRSDQRGLCGQASEGGAEKAKVVKVEGRLLSGDGVGTKMTNETELLAIRKDEEGSPEEICVDQQEAHAEQMGSARHPRASSLSDLSTHRSLAVKNSQTETENDSKEETEEKEQEKTDQEGKDQEREEGEEDGEERNEACEPHAKRVKRETSPGNQREGSRLSANPRRVGDRATPTKPQRKEEEGNSGDECGKASDAGRVKQRSFKTPMSRGRQGRSAGGKGAFLERLKAPHMCQLRHFLAPQVPAAAPLSRSWRLRPRPLEPEKDLHPGAVLCVSASAASLLLGLPSQHSPQPSPPFFMRDAVVHRVFFGSDRPSASRGPGARASGEEGADTKSAEVVGGQEGSEQCRGIDGGRRRGCFPTDILETQATCVRGEAEGEQGMLSQVKKSTELEGNTPGQDQGQRDERAASRESGTVILCREISGDRTKGDSAVAGVSAGGKGPETKESVSKSNNVTGNQLAMHVQTEPGAGAPRRASVSGLRFSPPGVSPAFGDGADLATDEEGKNKGTHASVAASEDAGAPSSDHPTTRKATRSLGVARSQVSPASQGEGRREKETHPQSRRGVGGAGAEGNLIGRRRDKRLDEGIETKKADESRETTHPASSSVACYDGVRPSERVTFVHLYFPYGNQQRIVSVEQLRKCACYRLPYDLHAHFPPESTQTVLRQAHDFLWAIPRALPLVPALTRAKRETLARRGARGPGRPPRGDSGALSQGVGSARETPEVSGSGSGAVACVDARDKEVWDEATEAPTREWSESPPFCMVYAALEDSPFRLPQHLQLVQLLQPELDFDALLGGTWRLRFLQWKPPAAPVRLERPLGFALPSEATFPRLLHHPSEGPPASGALTVSLPAWRRLRGWAPYPMDLSAASSPQVSPSHAVTQKVAEELAQPSQAADTGACTGTQEAHIEQAAIKDEQLNDVASSAPTPEEAHRLRNRKTETAPGVKQLDSETGARSNIPGEELEAGKAQTGHTLSQAPRSAASVPPFPVRSLSLPAVRDVGQPGGGETAHTELEDVFASGFFPWATVETLEGAQVDASGRWTSSALYLYEKLLFASWVQRQRVAALGDDACMRFSAPYRSVAEDIVEPTRSLWGVFSLPSDLEEFETGPEVVGEPLMSSGLDRPIQLDVRQDVLTSPDTSPKAEKPGKQTLHSRLGTQTGLSCSERRPVRLGKTPTKLEGSGNASRVGPETARAGVTRRTSPGSAPAWNGDGGLAFSRRPRLTRASAGISFLERERAGTFNAVYGQFPQPQGGLVRIVRDPEPPHPIFWDTETDEPPSRRPSIDNASLETVSGPSGDHSKAAGMCEIAFDEDSASGEQAGPTHGFTATDSLDTPTGAGPSDLTEQVRCKRPLVETETCDAGAGLQAEASHTKVARHKLAADSSQGSGQA